MSMRLPGYQASDEGPISRKDLLELFTRWCKGPERFRVGAEFEKLVVDRATGLQVTYQQEGGIEALLKGLAQRHGWTAIEEDGHTMALTRRDPAGTETVTLEPGGQVELSTPPCLTLDQMDTSLRRHIDEVRSCLAEGQEVLGVGFSPYSDITSVPLTTRRRHHIMADYLPQRGALALHMMKGTCSVQCALDYSSEEDMARKAFCALSLSPLVTAAFANSPLEKGALTGLRSFRGRIWQNTDPARSGVLGHITRQRDFSFDRWIDYLLDVPMMFYAIGDVWEPAHGRTFRDFMATGHNGWLPRREDWEMHLTSVFPEVRLKQFIEIRGADAVHAGLAMGFPALWKGLLYDEQALDHSLDVVRQIGAGDRAELFDRGIQDGLGAMWRGRSLGDWMVELVAAAREGLARQAQRLGHPDEGRHLDALEAQVCAGQSPAQRILDLYAATSAPTPGEVTALLAY